MKKIRFLICVLASIAMSFPVAHADEGMWLLPLLKQQNIEQMKGLGLEICAEDIYHPDSVSLKDAVVIFGGGCTGEVISPHGLILTNHHCGYDYIQAHSTVDNDLLTNGFWAKSRQEELPNPGLTVTFIDKIEEVTGYVEEELKKDTSKIEMKYLNAKFLNSLAEKRVGEEFLKNNPGTTVIIKPFYGGNRYYMFTQKVYPDVRMVGAPPSSIGKFGADTDNWKWPRHTGAIRHQQCSPPTEKILRPQYPGCQRKRFRHAHGISRPYQPLLHPHRGTRTEKYRKSNTHKRPRPSPTAFIERHAGRSESQDTICGQICLVDQQLQKQQRHEHHDRTAIDRVSERTANERTAQLGLG